MVIVMIFCLVNARSSVITPWFCSQGCSDPFALISVALVPRSEDSFLSSILQAISEVDIGKYSLPGDFTVFIAHFLVVQVWGPESSFTIKGFYGQACGLSDNTAPSDT